MYATARPHEYAVPALAWNPYRSMSGFAPRPVYRVVPRNQWYMSGFGAASYTGFNAAEAWNNWMLGQACGREGITSGPACTAAKRAVDAIRDALQRLGYGELQFGTSWGAGDQGAYKKFAADNGLADSRGMPTQGGLQVMESLLQSGRVTGPQAPIKTQKVGDEYVKQPSGLSKSSMVALGIGALALVGGLAILAKKKKSSQAPPSRP